MSGSNLLRQKSVEHITIEDNSLGNAHLYIKGKKDGQVEQVLTGLEKGQNLFGIGMVYYR